ncbi:Piwi domain-containing protein [Cytophaga hutchinsonii ATCC 33406]|nr:Piwi domain-containing protein [Cytophaga hutchinsonii ATCC 33406]
MTGLFVNFFECKLSKSKFNIYEMPYVSYNTKEKYTALRKENPDYKFYKVANTIYYWSITALPSTTLTGKSITVNTAEHPKVISKIIEESILAFFRTNYSAVYKKQQCHYWDIVSNKELLNPSIKGLSVKNQTHFNTYFFRTGENISYGFLLSTSLRLNITYTRQDFEKNNIAHNDLLGKDNIVFANTKALKRLLSATGQQENYDSQVAKLNANSESFKLISATYEWLNNNRSKIFLPDNNSIASISKKYLPLENNKIYSEKLNSPTRYYFGGTTCPMTEVDVRGNKTFISYDEQVKRKKPYSYGGFSGEEVLISILCPKTYEGILEGFWNKLEATLKGKLHLEKLRFNKIVLSGTAVENYESEFYNQDLLKSHLAIVIVDEHHKTLPVKKSPYHTCKAKLIGSGIPTQDIQVVNLKNANQFTINNIALNIYAKIGGTAWTIEKEDKRMEELVIGVGSSLSSDGKLVLGIAQIFHSDGRYLVGDCTPLSTFDNYAKNLEDYLYSAISNEIDRSLNKTKEFRLIFHLFKSASFQYEIKAVENLMKRFSDTDLTFKYAFVHLAYGHNFRMFNNDGNKDVDKGTLVHISSHCKLLHFTASSSIPLEILIDGRSTFVDPYYLSKQVYWFSHLSHRTFTPSKKTVTILYPALMSRLMEKLKEIEDWDTKRPAKDSKIINTLWFI